MCYEADEAYAVYDERTVLARKPHSCDACKEVIPVGFHYTRIAAIFDGTVETIKRCPRCQKMHEHLRTLGDHNDWPEEGLDCGTSYEKAFGTPPPEIEALAFATLADKERLLNLT